MNLFRSAHLLAVADVSVDLDPTFLVQFVLFATFVLLMRPLIFDPLLRVFEERERQTEGARDVARQMDERAGELLTRYEAELERVRAEAGRERDRVRAETSRLEGEILQAGKNETAIILAEGRARIDREVAALRDELERSRPIVAAEIASKVLGREVRS